MFSCNNEIYSAESKKKDADKENLCFQVKMTW